MKQPTSNLDHQHSDEQAKSLCLRLLTARDHTRAELDNKLHQKGYSQQTRQRVLDRLVELDLINDQRFAQHWVETRSERTGKARSALAAELSTKGIDEQLIADTLAQISPHAERSRAEELIRQQLRKVSLQDPVKLTRRLVGMLARRGYPPGLAYDVVRSELVAEQTRRQV